MSQTLDRRQLLKSALFGANMLGFRAMVSGIPLSILANPRRILAAEPPKSDAAPAYAPQYLVIATSDSGEPMNCNVPGMYEDPKFVHPMGANMTPTPFSLGGRTVQAAQPWSTLSEATLARTCFFHHSTGAFQHGTLAAVHALQGRARRGNMLVSLLGKALQPLLGSIQSEPIAMVDGGGESLIYEGRPQPNIGAQTLKSVLSTDDALKAISMAQKLRDRDLDALNKIVRDEGVPAHQALIDQWANSQTQARALPTDVLTALNGINDNSMNSRLQAAACLIRAKISPVINVRLQFGGDNHGDGGLQNEANQTVASLAAFNAFFKAVDGFGLTDSVSLATLTSFGRNNNTGNGRDHNGLHTCNVLIGKNFRGGVVGGATLQGNNAAAMAIDPISGAGTAGGSVQAKDTLAAYGLTLATGLGADTPELVDMISGEPARIKAALA